MVPAGAARISAHAWTATRLRIGGRDWRCISGYGHAPEHIALYCEALGVLISGDMVLPRISTNVSVYDIEPEANPLRLFLDSHRASSRRCPRTRWCCPRTASRSAACTSASTSCTSTTATASPKCWRPASPSRRSAADVLPVLFKRQLDLHQTTFAMGEAIAHLHALVVRAAGCKPLRSGARTAMLPLRPPA